MQNRDRLAEMAERARLRGEPDSWFEELYREGGATDDGIPWADGRPNPLLVQWLGWRRRPAAGRAVVVGCGLGDDAEELARRGYETTAFDIAPTAIARCRQRFPGSQVRYLAANATALPGDWSGRFELVFECYTLQALSGGRRRVILAELAKLVAPGGRLLLVSRGRDPEQVVDGPPWPLSRDELGPLEQAGLVLERFEDFVDPEQPGVRRFRVTRRRPPSR